MKTNDFGGAYDIAPDSSWSRDDLNALMESVNENTDSFEITALWLDKNDFLDIEYSDNEGNEFTSKNIKIDRRRADTTRKLCEVYTPVITEVLNENIKDFNRLLEADEIER